MPTPVMDRISRARWTRRSEDRHATGRHRAIIGTKYASPSMATGIPKISDWGLVVTFSQLMVPLLLQTRSTLSKWVTVR